MNQRKLEAYINALDDAGREFSVNFAKFDQVKNEAGGLKIGGAADRALAHAMTAANKFAMCLKLVVEERPTFFTPSSVRIARERVISHSRANLAEMNRLIDAVPESLRKGAEMTMAMSLLSRN